MLNFFCKERAAGMTPLAVAQVTERLWNPRAVNAAFTTGWKFRKSRRPTENYLNASSGLILFFFCWETLAEVLQPEFSLT